ncbi:MULTISPECIES: hypothetical protein [unclassified Microcoleus]|uniref:hypothetical protein n=1 Tax=unclassified Microcoleus TaxID=2642155 RepID=UPI002FD6F6C2
MDCWLLSKQPESRRVREAQTYGAKPIWHSDCHDGRKSIGIKVISPGVVSVDTG